MNLFEQVDPPLNNEREELTNKWKDKTPEEVLKAKIDSDLYIKTIERQKDEMRRDLLQAHENLKAKENLEDLIKELKSVQATPVTPTTQEVTQRPQLEAPDIDKMISDKIAQNKLSETQSNNFAEVQKKLQERFGSNAPAILKEQAVSMHLTDEDVNSLARKSPEAFFRIMGLNDQPKEDFMTPPRSAIRNNSYTPQIQKRTWSWYQNLKKSDPTTYWSAPTQLQMHKDSDQLGAAFEDGDFNA